ncbi:MAG: SPOR domain-containing protein [Bacteroidales bacterium]|nr:SPOR domain-containing protein [Bacteroidales bacterium]
MKRLAAILLVLIAAGLPRLGAQQPPEGYEWADSLVFTPLSAVDSLLSGRSIFAVLPDGVNVSQPAALRSALSDRIESNARGQMQGYRIRIFFNNNQTARGDSEAALYRFKVHHPGVAAYRSFANPYFKVTVGDYRSKSEALEALGPIKAEFPTAFIVRERFHYPAIGKESGFRVDTLRVLHAIKP